MKKIKIYNTKIELETNVSINRIVPLVIDNESICITQTKSGFYAFDNKCPHYSVPLETGNINFKDEVVCSLHAYRFDLKNGWETTGKKLCLKRYSIEISEDGVFLHL